MLSILCLRPSLGGGRSALPGQLLETSEQVETRLLNCSADGGDVCLGPLWETLPGFALSATYYVEKWVDNRTCQGAEKQPQSQAVSFRAQLCIYFFPSFLEPGA